MAILAIRRTPTYGSSDNPAAKPPNPRQFPNHRWVCLGLGKNSSNESDLLNLRERFSSP